MRESRYASLSRVELAALIPELLLIGQLIDRSGMPWCIQAFGRDEMLQIAIEQWAAASPVYTKRMQRALNFEGEDVITIFKGLQVDIGAPPQFMDFRYRLHDRWHGEFHLDHCGALLDVEPMGPDYVFGMCHTIEDPTFDATAVATNPRARVRPIHRPPREPVDRQPHCAWTVTIDKSHPQLFGIPALEEVSKKLAATVDLDSPVTTEEGRSDYSGPLLSDLDFGAFSHSALVRMADEVCLQMHLLYLSFVCALRSRAEDVQARGIGTKQLIGIAGLGAERIHRALNLPGGVEGTLQILKLHPLLNPAAYVTAEFGTDTVTVRRSSAHDDGAWVSLCTPAESRPLLAIVTAVDPHLGVEMAGSEIAWTVRVITTGTAAAELPEVSVAKVSRGAGFEFEPRRSLPITPA